MRDIEVAGRAVVEHPAAPPTPIDVIETRVQRRHRRHISSAVAVAVVVVIVSVAGGIGLARRTTSTSVAIATAPNGQQSVTDEQMRAHLGLDVPKGWLPVDFGDARVFIPPNWKVTPGTCPTGTSGSIQLGPSSGRGCGGGAGGGPFVGVLSYAGNHQPTATRTVHGYRLYRLGGENPFLSLGYDVPDLHVAIYADGNGADQVLATLGPSSAKVALSYRGTQPDGWQQIAFNRITLSTPVGWTHRSNAQFCSVPPDSVTFGLAPVPCGEAATSYGPGVNGVVLSPPELFSDHPASVLSITNGVLGTAQLSLTENDGRALTLFVSVDASHAVPIQLGLGRDGRVAAAIFDSIRVEVSSAPEKTPGIEGSWKLVSIAGYEHSLVDLPPLTFSNATWSGSDGCNSIGGRYQVGRGGEFRVEDVGGTLIGCRSGTTVPVAHVLVSATHVALVGESLTFFDGNDRLLGRFERARATTSTTAPTG
jgi:heat shock protein HslJ